MAVSQYDKENLSTSQLAQIATKIPLYNKSGGKAIAGLTRRRQAEQALFNT